MTQLINPTEFNSAVKKLRTFFTQKGYTEVHTQNRLSILAACEDPTTVATYNYNGQIWPLPQTGQMWLEYELLTKPELNGVFCVSTSYRQEQNPVPGRHDTIFPMFEFDHPPIRRKSWHELHDKFCQEAFEGIPSCLLRTTTDAVRFAANDYLSPHIRRP